MKQVDIDFDGRLYRQHVEKEHEEVADASGQHQEMSQLVVTHDAGIEIGPLEDEHQRPYRVEKASDDKLEETTYR